MRSILLVLVVFIIVLVEVILFDWASHRWLAVSSHPFLFALFAGIVCFVVVLIFAARRPRKTQPDRLLTTARPKPGSRPTRVSPTTAPPPAPAPPAPVAAAPPTPSAPPAPAGGEALLARLPTLLRPPPPLTPTYASPERVKESTFTAYFPRSIRQEQWKTLLAYMYAPRSLRVAGDARRRFEGEEDAVDYARAEKTAFIAHGTSILVVPHSESMEFNPPQISFIWLEEFHCAEFRFRALQPAAASAAQLSASIGFYVPPLLIGEIDFTVSLGESPAQDRPPALTTAAPYQRIFVSYSHDDSEIADSLERAYKALGNEYLRDINTLRSGEEWNPALLELIDKSEIFQLLWSQASERSKYVRQEWQHALSLQRKQFIRPVYWKKPMPSPPPELASIHFAYVDL
jgi:hypothetical protein